jgi:GMP synthase (glutamine-hydrolysing)
MTDSPTPRFLLLQARRPEDPTAAHEHACFAESLNVSLGDIQVHNLLSGPPSQESMENRLLLVGGSGEFSVLDKHPFVRTFLQFLDQEVLQRKRPTFASCFGFQGLVIAGGGTVIHDSPNTEVGTFKITLTNAGCKDPLLGALAPSFNAQEGHKDRADQLPAGITNLAYSERAPFQAFRVDDAPIVATQFHPELSRAANTKRYLWYHERYGQANVHEDDVLSTMEETPKATALLRRWVGEATSQ